MTPKIEIRYYLTLLGLILLFGCVEPEPNIDRLPFPIVDVPVRTQDSCMAPTYGFMGEIRGLPPNTPIDSVGYVWSSLDPMPSLKSFEGIYTSRVVPKDFIAKSTCQLLCPDRTYYVRGFAFIRKEVHYSDPFRFHTDNIPCNCSVFPKMGTDTLIDNVFHIALSGELVRVPIGQEIEEAGFYWGEMNLFQMGLKQRVFQNVGTVTDTQRNLRDVVLTIDTPGVYFFQPFIKVCENEILDTSVEFEVRIPWFPLSVVIETPRNQSVGFAVNGRGYVAGGKSNNSILGDIWEFTPNGTSSGTWSKVLTEPLAPPETQRFEAVGFAINGRGYLLTGEDIDGVLREDFWEFDPMAHTWMKKGNFPGDPRKGAIAFSLNNKGYVGLGFNDKDNLKYHKDLWEYNPSGQGSWRKVKEFIGEGRGDAIAFAIEETGKAYVGIGEDNTQKFNDFYEFAPMEGDSGMWYLKAEFLGVAREKAVGFSIRGKGYIGIGEPARGFWEYVPDHNGGLGKWNRKLSWNWRPDAIRVDAVSFIIGDRAYIGTGSEQNIRQNDFWIFDPNTEFQF